MYTKVETTAKNCKRRRLGIREKLFVRVTSILRYGLRHVTLRGWPRLPAYFRLEKKDQIPLTYFCCCYSSLDIFHSHRHENNNSSPHIGHKNSHCRRSIPNCRAGRGGCGPCISSNSLLHHCARQNRHRRSRQRWGLWAEAGWTCSWTFYRRCSRYHSGGPTRCRRQWAATSLPRQNESGNSMPISCTLFL